MQVMYVYILAQVGLLIHDVPNVFGVVSIATVQEILHRVGRPLYFTASQNYN